MEFDTNTNHCFKLVVYTLDMFMSVSFLVGWLVGMFYVTKYSLLLLSFELLLVAGLT